MRSELTATFRSCWPCRRPSGKVDAVCREITRRIGGRLTYTSWAVAKGYLRWNWEDSDWLVIQTNRLNWLRELQREYRKKGD